MPSIRGAGWVDSKAHGKLFSMHGCIIVQQCILPPFILQKSSRHWPNRLELASSFSSKLPKRRACVCELVDSFLEPRYRLSRHLKILRLSGLVTTQ